MPEGPEIRRAADRLAAVLLDRPLERVWFARADLEAFSERLAASRVVAVDTRGKALLTRFANGLTVYSHNQLYGRWYVRKAGNRPKTRRQLRWLMETPSHAALLYSASTLEVLDEAGLAEQPFLARAGIDVLADRPTLSELARYVSEPRFAGRSLGHLLLDQGFLAGTGNYLRSEILFAARLHPARRLGEVNGHARRRLAREAIRLTERAYETGGITNDPKLAARLKRQGWTRRRFRHWVFGRAGQPCHRCGTKIEKDIVAGRRLYLCPHCQPALEAG